MNEGQNLQSQRHCIVVFLLGIADTFWCKRTISPPDYQNVVVAIIYDTLDELPLFFICCGKELHSCRNAVHFHKGLNNLLPFLLKISIRRTDKYLISLIHIFSTQFIISLSYHSDIYPHPRRAVANEMNNRLSTFN